jgi:hypothetical protein
MDKELLIKCNSLIGDFMGLKWNALYLNPYDKSNALEPEDLMFHSSWDWLRLVLDKIWKKSDEDMREFGGFEIFELGLFAEKEDVYRAVIQFIENYEK